MEWVGGVDGIGGVGEAVRSSVCRVLVGGLNLLDHDLLALEQIGIAATAMGTGLAMLDRRIVAAARLAMRHGVDGLHDKLRALGDRLFICRPAPSVEQQVGNDARDLAQQQRHARNATNAMNARHILNIANNVIDDSQFMQGEYLSTMVDAMSAKRQRAAIQVPQVAPKQGVRWAFARGAEVEGQDGVPGRRAASAVPPFVRTAEPNDQT